MAAHPLQDFIRRLRRAHSAAEDGHLTDAQLLERFIHQGDEAAFEVLVWRHGALVLNVAQRLVRRPADAEDVFQATFLTLARKAASIRRGTAVGSWLYKVAYRIALRVRQAALRRERREQAIVESMAPVAPLERDDTEVAAALADEVCQLPERYRAAVILCYLQGSTTEEAARVLGCPRGTILSRLAWARQRLRNRLVRRGLAPMAALAAVSFGATASAMPPVALVASTIRAALPFAAGRAAVSTVSSQVAALAQGALQTMLWNKIKIAAAMMCAIGLAGAGAGWMTHGRVRMEATPAIAEQPAKQPAPRTAEDERENKLQKQSEMIRERLTILAVEEARQEDGMGKERLAARLQLIEAEDQLRLRETELSDEREERQGRMKKLAREIDNVQGIIEVSDVKSVAESPISKEAKRRLTAFKKERDLLRQRGGYDRSEFLRAARKQVYQAEEALRRIETHQARQRDTFAAKRDALLARLQQLEGMSLHLDPADHIRDVERKLDALRRDVGALRRTLERQTGEPRKKP
jgi:RNA polymerase sigma factor (sigma-70 family)